MAVWTEAQQKVIDTRNKNMLVSAAAGSGKTAVLVERIIAMISEGENPKDIDRLLVVTFTNAAAAQMRERIGKAIDKKLLLDPDNEHLQKQISLLQSAQITTIHSFCLNVIRNYFHRIDLDPSFKIAEESEITLMKSDVISDILERWYEEGREDFHSFIESYSYSKSDEPVESLILQLYSFAMSDPWPETWLKHKQKAFELNTMEELNASEWMQDLLKNVMVLLDDLLQINGKALAICNGSGGPTAYVPALVSDRELLCSLKQAGSYEEYANAFMNIAYDRLSGKKEEGVQPWLKEKVKALREDVKNGIKDLKNQYFFQPPQEMLKDLQEVREVMGVLFELTMEFIKEFAKKKEEKNLIDFNDLEHFALKILVENQGEKVPTPAALELSEQFEEIMVDEYQDSNLVQETILRSICREHLGIANRFMVGDVKQSIYKFRLAMPEIFLEKYKTYSIQSTLASGEDNPNLRIDLDKNFRSRKVVLDFVNEIFQQIMTEAVGDIKYDEAASLKYGELFEELIDTADKLSKAITADNNGISDSVELLLVTEEEAEEEIHTEGGVDLDQEITTADEEEINYTKKELEARAIAKRIKELVDPYHGLKLFNRDTMTHYTANYKDIVILLRSMSGWSEVLVNTLMQEGIPAYADTGTGYFQTVEIMTVLNMLRIIDNPRQDIPLTGVLYSPVIGLTTTELAMIRAFDRTGSMYSAVQNYAANGSNAELKAKLGSFLTQLEAFREMVKHIPISELILNVLEQTGYYYVVMAMPGGERRKANIDMLVSQAVRFEKGSYSGLFHFIHYIEKLRKYEVDFGEAQVSGENDNTVRIMSIHKSKGLEFPIVFVAGLSKQFNTQDLRNPIVLHAEYGVGPEYIDSKKRTKIPTLLKKVIQKKVQIENMGEELRVLYVAMTRAKEKLILSGYLKDRSEIRKKDFSFYEILSSKSYLDLVLPAAANRYIKRETQDQNASYNSGDGFVLTILQKQELLQEEVTRQIFLQADEQELMSLSSENIDDSRLREEIKSRFNFTYLYGTEAKLRVKMTVSELKKLGQFIDEELSENLYLTDKDESEVMSGFQPDKKQSADHTTAMEFEPTLPDFIRGKETAVTGTDRGTLYHKVLELIDLQRIQSREDMLQEFAGMVQKNQLMESEIQMLKQDYIFNFTQSSIADRMRKAQQEGKLYKEQQFVLGIPANEVHMDFNSSELILIQGIIDVFFEEDGQLVLLDYKSDRLEEDELFIKRYQIQLEYYKRALEQILKKRVKEMVIYSLYLGREIRID